MLVSYSCFQGLGNIAQDNASADILIEDSAKPPLDIVTVDQEWELHKLNREGLWQPVLLGETTSVTTSLVGGLWQPVCWEGLWQPVWQPVLLGGCDNQFVGRACDNQCDNQSCWGAVTTSLLGGLVTTSVTTRLIGGLWQSVCWGGYDNQFCSVVTSKMTEVAFEQSQLNKCSDKEWPCL